MSSLVKVTLPNYLSNLPIPDSFTGWFRLGGKLKIIFYSNYFIGMIKNRLKILYS